MEWIDRGEVYAGDWKDDVPHGEGEYVWDNSKVLYYHCIILHSFNISHCIFFDLMNRIEYQETHNEYHAPPLHTTVSSFLFIISYHIILYHIMSYHIILYHIMSLKTTFASKQLCNIYRGTFVDGFRCGMGSFFYSDGSQYTGMYMLYLHIMCVYDLCIRDMTCYINVCYEANK